MKKHLFILTILITISTTMPHSESIELIPPLQGGASKEIVLTRVDDTSLGTFKITYYNGQGGIEGGSKNCQGDRLSEGMIAVDPDVIPLGSEVTINGQDYTACDVGGMINGNHIDVYRDVPHAELDQMGVNYEEVFLKEE